MIIKKWMVGFVLFLAALTGTAQSHVPTLQSNNVWLGSNTFNGGLHVPVLQRCVTPQVMAGYNTDFTPICVTVSGSGAGVTSLNSLTGTVGITNTDSNLNISAQGNNVQINCPGCGGSGGTPGGSNGAIQTNQAGAFSGTVINGIVFAQGSSNPRAAIADTDFALPFALTCTGGGISCPKVGENYTFTVSGGAGSGVVSSALFGQMGGYAATGTTISGAPNVFSLNPAWSLSQMNGLFARFSGTLITGWSITSNVVTMTGPNSFNAGDTPYLVFFANGTFFDNQSITISATGLSNTQFEFSFTHADTSFTADSGYATFNVPNQPLSSQGLVIIPPGLIDQPSTAFVNQSLIGPAAQVLDARKGFWIQQASAYGVKCDEQELYVTLTAGSDLVNVGASFSSLTKPIGMDMVVGQQVGFAETGVQNTWDAKVIAYPYPNLQLSAVAPFNYSGLVHFGTNNSGALSRAFADLGGGIPLWLPQCNMLTSTVRWPGTSLLGQQMSSTTLVGFPGQDILQQQSLIPITAWSINASTGVTTFTIPAYASHNILVGDNINLQNFPTSTFFNGQGEFVATLPSPTTFTVNATFGQSTSSATEAGGAGPKTNVSTNALQAKNFGFAVNQQIHPGYSWNSYDQNGTLTVEPPMYRPLQEFNQPMNNPFAPGWGTGQVNGVATIVQNTAVICSPNAGRVPVVGTTFVLPYQTGGVFTALVNSTSGSCAAGFTARTLNANLPNTSGFTATQAEWFTFTTPQSLGLALPGTITLPYTLYLNIPFPPVAGWESNVSSHGHIRINNDEWDYMGDQFGGTASTSNAITSVANASGGTTVYTGTFTGYSCSGTQVFQIAGLGNAANNGVFLCNAATGSTLTMVNPSGVAETHAGAALYPAPSIVLRNGPTSVNGGAGDAANTVVVPLNPCQAMYHNPWPVVPTINSGTATPVNATYYAGLCGGNAAIALPTADAAITTFNGSGFSIADFNNVSATNSGSNGIGNSNSNGSMFMYQQANNTGYGNTFNNIRVNNLWGGFMQGPASVNQHGVRAIGPTSTGQSITNCTFRTGYAMALVSFEQSNIDRCDTYSTEVSDYDGTVVGATTGLDIGSTLSEQDGGGVTGVFQFTVKDYNNEPENGDHDEFSPSVISDGNNITWLGTIFEGGYNIFGGSFQLFHGTQMAVPIFNYGVNNYFEHLYAVNIGYNDANVYNGQSSFYNWGQYSTCQAQTGAVGPLRGCGAGFMQDYNGHDAWSTMFGNPVLPTYNILGGMIPPEEFSSGTMAVVFDSTEPWWGKHSECPNIVTGCGQSNFDGIGGGIFIGFQQRVSAAPVVIKMDVRAKNTGTFTFRLFAGASNAGSSPTCTFNNNIAQGTFTATSTGWTAISLPVDYTPYASCTISLNEDTGSATNTLEMGYVNIVPFPGEMYIPLGTPTLHAACPVAGAFQVDTGFMWICAPTSGHAFGTGTWKQAPLT
jgi:hypothetical protein